MKLLHSIAIPKISFEWKTVADFLELDLSLIKIIQERCNNDPTTCCGEMLREWLMSDSGLQPKTWSTLIKTLKMIKKLASVTGEIEENFKSMTLFVPVYVMEY